MPGMDPAAVILRATDLLWCLAIADVGDFFEDRSSVLEELKELEQRIQRSGQWDLYAAVVEAQERRARVEEWP